MKDGVIDCMDMNKLNELKRELERASLAVERCEKELGEVLEGGIDDDELDKIDEISADLAVAAERFEKTVNNLKHLSKSKS